MRERDEEVMGHDEARELLPPGWYPARRGGTKVGAIGSNGGVFALTWDEVVWRAWCHTFDLYSVGVESGTDWPERPENWRERIAAILEARKTSRIVERIILMEGIPSKFNLEEKEGST